MYAAFRAVLSFFFFFFFLFAGLRGDSGDGHTASDHPSLGLDLRNVTEYLMNILTDRVFVCDVKEKFCYIALVHDAELMPTAEISDKRRSMSFPTLTSSLSASSFSSSRWPTAQRLQSSPYKSKKRKYP